MDTFSLFGFRRPQRPTSGSARRMARLRIESLESRELLTCNEISGHVFNDLNNNGRLDSGEPLLANSTIELRNASGTRVGLTTTDGNGFYRFDADSTVSTAEATLTRNLTVSDIPTDWERTLSVARFDPNLGTLLSVEILNSGAITSDIAVENRSTSSSSNINATVSGTITLAGAGFTLTMNPQANAGNYAATVYDGSLDFAGNSGHDFGTKTATASTARVLTAARDLAQFTGTGNVTFTQRAHATSTASGGGNLISQITTTAAAQLRVVYHYIPNNCLRPGNYTIIQVSQPAGYLDGKDSRDGTVVPNSNESDVIQVNLTNRDLDHNDFGELKAASVAGWVYVDRNNNGVRDAGEPGIGGVTITLTGTTERGPVRQTTITAGNGAYRFDGLLPGTYNLVETQPRGYQDGKDSTGSVGGQVSDDQFSGIALAQGTAGVEYNFGEIPIAVVLRDAFECPSVDFIRPANLPILSKLQFLSTPGQPTLSPEVLAQVVYVDGLYRNLLGRPADVAGISYWVPRLMMGTPRSALVTGLWVSAEHRGMQVDMLYQNLLGRAADPNGRASWVNALMNGATELDVARMLLLSAEYQATRQDDTVFMSWLYGDVLGRQGRPEEITGWAQALQSGLSREAVVRSFFTSAEFDSRMVDCAYQGYLGRFADSPGRQAWVGVLTSGRMNLEAVRQAFLASDECFARARAASRS